MIERVPVLVLRMPPLPLITPASLTLPTVLAVRVCVPSATLPASTSAAAGLLHENVWSAPTWTVIFSVSVPLSLVQTIPLVTLMEFPRSTESAAPKVIEPKTVFAGKLLVLLAICDAPAGKMR